MTLARILTFIAAVALFLAPLAQSQESDYELQKRFENRTHAIRGKLDSAASTQEFDALRNQIDAVAIDFQPNKDFLDKAMYPATFEGTLNDLRDVLRVAYGRTSTIQSQGVRINELESSVSNLTVRLDTLSTEREHLFVQLTVANKTIAGLRETVKRLTANLDAQLQFDAGQFGA